MSVVVAACILSVIFFIGGMLALLAAVMGWNWFFNSYGVKMLTYKLSRTSARILYAIIGVCIIAMAVKILFEAHVF